MVYISNFGGVFVIGYFLNPISIAFYEVAGKIPQGFSRLFASFRIVYFPSLSSLISKGDTLNAQKFINSCLTIMSTLGGLIVITSVLFSEEIITLIFSAEYLEVKTTFILLTFSVCMQLIATTMGYSLVAAGKPKESMFSSIVGISIELVLSILLIPIYGYVGASIAFVIMTFVMQGISSYYLRNIGIKINIWEYFKPILCLFSLALVFLLFDFASSFYKLIYLFSYLGLCFAFVQDFRSGLSYVMKMVFQPRQLSQ